MVSLSLAAQPNPRFFASDISRRKLEAPTTPLAPVVVPALVQPEFPGGDAALIEFLGRSLRYPAEAGVAGAEGKVIVSFWIDEQGHPYGFGAVESPHPSLAAEALRAMRMMPNWVPGRRVGQLVPLLVHVPVVFRLPAGTASRF